MSTELKCGRDGGFVTVFFLVKFSHSTFSLSLSLLFFCFLFVCLKAFLPSAYLFSFDLFYYSLWCVLFLSFFVLGVCVFWFLRGGEWSCVFRGVVQQGRGNAPSTMSMTVPEVILVGQKTRYRHFARGSRDLYAPEEMLPDPPPQHVWSYCVSREHNNTVYFHNDASGRSLWVLPSLASDGTEAGGGAEEVMRTVGSVESASAAQKHVKFGMADEKGHEAAAVRRTVMRQSIVKAMKQAETQKPIETVQTKPPTGPVAETLNNENNDGNNGAAPVRERLAVWRAKRAQQQQQKEHGGNDPGSSSYGGVEESRVNHGRPAFSDSTTEATKMTPSLDNKIPSQMLDCVVAQKGSEFKKGDQFAQDIGNLERSGHCQQQQQQQHNSLERDVYDERRRLFLEAHEELQREKSAALQKERLALEQVARLQEAQRREEEERTRLAAERKKLELQRLELQKRVLERQRELLAKVEEEAIQRELAAQLDNFFENKSRLEQQAQEERQRVLSFEDAIAESLLGTAVKNPTAPPKEERIIDLRLLEESDDDTEDENNNNNNNNNNRHGVSGREETRKSRNFKEIQDSPPHKRQKDQQQPRRERISYSPSLVYVGDVTGGGSKTPAFLQRQGRGTFFYDTAQKHFFDGEWSGDKRNGSGALSLPHVAVEGTWRDDVLEGCATFQTKRLKGKGEFKQGVLDGNAVVEIDCNSVFAGNVKKNGAVVTSGAVTLASGDHVEWIRDENSNDNNKNRQQTSAHSKNFNNGTGRCRIQFENGDVYVGEVENYQPHGAGTYRFAAEGQEYVGNFQNGRLQGRGTYHFANGNVYIGQFYKGLFHGEGRYVEQDAYTYEGFWEYGTAHGRGKLIFANGDVWEGEFDHDRRVNGRYTASHLFQL
ncbi:hypothetical protein MOQ_006001 [Trypanosoma cruzi marinkellei]|uniref:WW domain-containing protein n=1 Tax=Trypanosoma cruzi marinkellei TaxID=85056 RepID=K2N6D4_TRYCR|nr:hypothetical protein MOQ_006001 [Trypanosoma cruzi marinkellei]